MQPKKKKVVVIGTGGTIAMKRGADGALVPYQSMKDMIRESPEMKDISKKYAIETIDLMNLDSSDLASELKNWEKLGEAVVEAVNRKDVEGVVITHGTDTMAPTAQYLDYSIKNLTKPVVLTGAQKAVTEPDSDGIPNLKDGIIVAAHGHFAEVLITFKNEKGEGEIWKAENAIKARIWDQQPFRAVERNPVGSVINGEVIAEDSSEDNSKYDPSGRDAGYTRQGMPAWLEKDLFDFEGIDEIIIRPVMNAEKLMKIAKSPETKAIIIHGFGAGNIAETYHPSIEEATKRGKLVVMCSQADGPVDMLEYGLGRRALEKGALPAGDRRPEEVYMRLAHVLGAVKKIKKEVDRDRALQLLLKDNDIELGSWEIGKYLFMSGSRFRKPYDDMKKYGDLLNVDILEDDMLRHPWLENETFYNGIPGLIQRQLSKRMKTGVVYAPHKTSSGPAGEGTEKESWHLLAENDNGIFTRTKYRVYTYNTKTKTCAINDTDEFDRESMRDIMHNKRDREDAHETQRLLREHYKDYNA